MIYYLLGSYLLVAFCAETAMWYTNATYLGSFSSLQIPRRKAIAVASFWLPVFFWLLMIRFCTWAVRRWKLDDDEPPLHAKKVGEFLVYSEEQEVVQENEDGSKTVKVTQEGLQKRPVV